MKRKVFLVGILLFSPVLGIFVAAREAASWRPVRVGFAPNAYLISVSRGGWIQTQTENSVILQRGGHMVTGKGVEGAILSPDESLVALSGGQGEPLRIVRMQDGREIHVWHKLPLQKREFFGAGRFENDNRVFVAVSPFRVLRLDVERGKVLSQVKMRFPFRLAEGCGMMNGISFLKNGDLYYLNGDEGFIVNTRTGFPKRKAEMGTLSPDESLLYNWSPETGEGWVTDFKRGKLSWQKDMDDELVFSPDSHSLLVVQSGKVRLLNARTGKLIRDLKMPLALHYAFSPDGNALYSLGKDGQILRWRLR